MVVFEGAVGGGGDGAVGDAGGGGGRGVGVVGRWPGRRPGAAGAGVLGVGPGLAGDGVSDGGQHGLVPLRQCRSVGQRRGC